jgi:ATP-dependent DNA helicase Q1
VNEMVKYAQDYVTCRKILFERYFSLEQRKEGLVNKITPDQPCGICDNCNRTDEIQVENIYLVAKSIIQLCNILRTVNERVTMPKLVQMVQGRGLGLVKTQVLSNPGIGLPLDRKYSEYVK